jgi:hypothetical protein
MMCIQEEMSLLAKTKFWKQTDKTNWVLIKVILLPQYAWHMAASVRFR